MDDFAFFLRARPTTIGVNRAIAPRKFQKHVQLLGTSFVHPESSTTTSYNNLDHPKMSAGCRRASSTSLASTSLSFAFLTRLNANDWKPKRNHCAWPKTKGNWIDRSETRNWNWTTAGKPYKFVAGRWFILLILN